MNDIPPDAPWEDDDDLTDFDAKSVLDALDLYVPTGQAGDPWDLPEPLVGDDDHVQTLLFTAANPPGTVSVTTLLDGRILRVDLDPQVEALTESQLAEEISIIATLARQQARAAQHAVVLEFMGKLGHDRVATRGFLEHDLGLPSPQSVMAEKAQVFAMRYAGDGE
jgi:hypothetical protein